MELHNSERKSKTSSKLKKKNLDPSSSQKTAIVFGNDQSTVISVEQLLKGGFARLKIDGGYREVAALTVHRNVF